MIVRILELTSLIEFLRGFLGTILPEIMMEELQGIYLVTDATLHLIFSIGVTTGILATTAIILAITWWYNR